jgi:hypothetical protein
MASMHDDLALYVIGALEDPREFEAHLATCEQCRAELAQLRGTLDVLDAGIVRTPAPVDLRAKTLAAIRGAETGVARPEGPPPITTTTTTTDNIVSFERARARRARIVSIASVAALALVIAGLGYRTVTREGFSVDRSFALSAVDGGAARGEAKIDDRPQGQVIELTVSGLPDAPAGMYYECWWVGPNDADDVQDRVSAGTFRGGNGTYRMQSSANPSHFTKMGITLEPDDGNPKRTGAKVLTSAPAPGGSAAPSAAASTSPSAPAVVPNPSSAPSPTATASATAVASSSP